MIGAIRKPLRYGFELIERPFERVFGPALNPLAQLGALGFFFFWIVAVSGIYLFIFFDTGIEQAYQSVESITNDHWYHAGVMRSLHRYASDLMVVMVATHLLREFAYDHYRGARFFSWLTGLPIIWLLYASGITGYWLVWDKLAQYVAIISSELLDWLPIFGEPIARNFIATGTLTSRFFTLMVFMHIAVPLFLLFLMWVHILRISRPKVNPPRTLALMSLAALIGVSLWNPAVSQGHVDLARAPVEVGLDWFYLPLYPLTDIWGKGAVWAFLGAFSVMIGLMPWLPPLRRAKAAEVTLDHCNGCGRCAEDCPYEAIRMVRRTDALPFPTQAEVNPSLCVSCGICTGSCPSSTPFRRSEELVTGIDLPEYSLKELRERTRETAAALEGPGRVLVFACEHGAGAGGERGVVPVPCVAMVPPSFFDFVLSRKLADGVVVAGCAESACFNRLGVTWTQERFTGARDPYLRARVPRERIKTIWASTLEVARFERERAAFAAEIAALPPPVARKAQPSAPAARTPAPDRVPEGTS
ncbi:MAG: cytochrome b N-terminal domain-containing protein [Xanthobacteraceae bacterium]|nr:cytochrome b N-terminal domain-containing protein [Xanthobacteraceae bacterium]PWB61194.1 MAG: cytochrome b/b6-like protein [Bradyrhizobiaceae bacterium]